MSKPPVSPKSPREPQRIAKLLARAGIASRREIERMIADGRVSVGGAAIDTPATLLTSLNGVAVDGNPVQAAAPARLFLYHKPAGLLVTERDPAGRPTIYDRLPADLPRLVPVGRLDLNTEGLLLLTTDGELKRQLELPATGVERAYRARAYGAVTQAQLEDLIEGVEIEGVRYGSINANLERRTGANVWIEMILTEGKNREVRRVLEYLGLKVSRLIRTRYGPFVLGDLPPGEIGEVRQHDVVAFRKNPTRNPPPEKAEERRKGLSAPASSTPRQRSERPMSGPVSGPASAATRAPRVTPVQLGQQRPARGAARQAEPGAPQKAALKPVARITRATANSADRAAFADARPPRRTRDDPQRDAIWSPRDSRPAELRATPPASPARPKRFYDAKPRQRADGPADARPARVFNPELGRNVRARPPRDARANDRPSSPASPKANAPASSGKPTGKPSPGKPSPGKPSPGKPSPGKPRPGKSRPGGPGSPRTRK